MEGKAYKFLITIKTDGNILSSNQHTYERKHKYPSRSSRKAF
jgi:hypothetical protein